MSEEFLQRCLEKVEEMTPEEVLELHNEAQRTIMNFREYMMANSKPPDPELAKIIEDNWEDLI